MNISTNAEKKSDKTPHPYMIRNIKKKTTRGRSELSQHNKDHLGKDSQLTLESMVKD